MLLKQVYKHSCNKSNRINKLLFNLKPRYLHQTTTTTTPKQSSLFNNKTKLLLASGLLLGGYSLLNDSTIQLEETAPIYTDKSSYIQNPDPRIAFKNKSFYDLCISLFVYKLCSLPYLMDAAPTLLSLLETLHLSAPAYFFIKRTIFKHFCGGEDREDVVPFMHQLKDQSIGSILDFSIEADLESEDGHLSKEELRVKANQHADFVTEQYVQAVKTASNLKGSFIAVKVTGLISPQLLEKATTILHYLRNSFIIKDDNQDGLLNRNEFKSILLQLPNINEKDTAVINQIIQNADPTNSNKIDWISFLASLSMVKNNTKQLYITNDNNASNDENINNNSDESMNNNNIVTNNEQNYKLNVQFFNKEEQKDFELLMNRLNKICSQAKDLDVRLMIDAEQSYFQAAIDLVANELSQQYNQYAPIIYNTYQLYLKESYEKMRNDLIHAKRENWCFGAKLVRGAYMVSERKRALELGLPDIIQNTIEDTHHDYNLAVDLLLKEIEKQKADEKKIGFMVASHNKDSIVSTCRKMEQLKFDTNQQQQVLFGQLMGMHDPTTYSLANYGFNAFKYIPYGPVKEVMPYLIRRAQENSSVMQGANLEQLALWNEIKFRCKFNSFLSFESTSN